MKQGSELPNPLLLCVIPLLASLLPPTTLLPRSNSPSGLLQLVSDLPSILATLPPNSPQQSTDTSPNPSTRNHHLQPSDLNSMEAVQQQLRDLTASLATVSKQLETLQSTVAHITPVTSPSAMPLASPLLKPTEPATADLGIAISSQPAPHTIVGFHADPPVYAEPRTTAWASPPSSTATTATTCIPADASPRRDVVLTTGPRAVDFPSAPVVNNRLGLLDGIEEYVPEPALEYAAAVSLSSPDASLLVRSALELHAEMPTKCSTLCFHRGDYQRLLIPGVCFITTISPDVSANHLFMLQQGRVGSEVYDGGGFLCLGRVRRDSVVVPNYWSFKSPQPAPLAPMRPGEELRLFLGDYYVGDEMIPPTCFLFACSCGGGCQKHPWPPPHAILVMGHGWYELISVEFAAVCSSGRCSCLGSGQCLCHIACIFSAQSLVQCGDVVNHRGLWHSAWVYSFIVRFTSAWGTDLHWELLKQQVIGQHYFLESVSMMKLPQFISSDAIPLSADGIEGGTNSELLCLVLDSREAASVQVSRSSGVLNMLLVASVLDSNFSTEVNSCAANNVMSKDELQIGGQLYCFSRSRTLPSAPFRVTSAGSSPSVVPHLNRLMIYFGEPLEQHEQYWVKMLLTIPWDPGVQLQPKPWLLLLRSIWFQPTSSQQSTSSQHVSILRLFCCMPSMQFYFQSMQLCYLQLFLEQLKRGPIGKSWQFGQWWHVLQMMVENIAASQEADEDWISVHLLRQPWFVVLPLCLFPVALQSTSNSKGVAVSSGTDAIHVHHWDAGWYSRNRLLLRASQGSRDDGVWDPGGTHMNTQVSEFRLRSGFLGHSVNAPVLIQPTSVFSRRRRSAVPSPSTPRLAFLRSVVKPLNGILPRPAIDKRRRRRAPVDGTLRRSSRLASRGAGRPGDTLKSCTRVLMRRLGVLDEEDDAPPSPADMARYDDIFKSALSEVQIAALAALYGWTAPPEDELRARALQGGTAIAV